MCAALSCYFFFNDTATTEIYTLSLHDALPISGMVTVAVVPVPTSVAIAILPPCKSNHFLTTLNPKPVPGLFSAFLPPDRKSTRLNSSHANISYAVFCLKKKKTQNKIVYCYRNL